MLGPFAPTSISRFAARNFREEIKAVAVWPVAMTMVEGSITGILAKKAFEGTPDWIVATLAAAPAFSNVTSLVWTRFARGERTLRNLNLLQGGVIAVVLAIGLVPRTTAGLYVFTLAAVAARLLMTGVITLRAVLWRANYAREERAAITGRLVTVQTLVVTLTGLLLGRSLDENPQSFHFMYAAASLFGLLGLWFFSRMRVRRPHLIDPSDASDPAAAGTDETTGWSFGGLVTEWASTFSDMLRVMRDDAAYRGFMTCMFVMGISNLAVEAPMIVMLDEQFGLRYLHSIALLQAIPLALMPVSIPFWSRLMSHSHIIRFRSIHSWTFVIGQFAMFFGALWDSLPILTFAQAMQGVGFGGGALAWNLGHNDFATPQKASLYMTVHVTLNGIRGFIAAYVGMWLYAGLTWRGRHYPLLGDYAFLFWAIVCLLGALGFVYLNFRFRELTRRRPREH